LFTYCRRRVNIRRVHLLRVRGATPRPTQVGELGFGPVSQIARDEVSSMARTIVVSVALCALLVFLAIWPRAAPGQPTAAPAPASSFCSPLAQRLGGIAVPNGPVCDVVVVRKAPMIRGTEGMNLNQFTLMNSVLEFIMKPGAAANEVYVMGDFALLETEMNPVLGLIKGFGWTVTGIHNHMVQETPKTTFVHWEASGNLDTLVTQLNQAFQRTSIK
jgi:uncharacterized protein DUF1259